MILIIDNYDSFTYNLYQFVGTINPDITVIRNDKITADDALALNPERIIISPGPGFPKDAGICIELIQKAAGKVPLMGVCLGHQAIAEAFGGKIVHAPVLMHGKSDTVTVNTDCPLFKGVPEKIEAGRYHSLMVESESLPDVLEVTAHTADGCIMGIKHKDCDVYGIQFHPESVLTPDGMEIIRNFTNI